MSVIDEIMRERLRQTEKFGYFPEHDDDHVKGELADAAATYILIGSAHFRRLIVMGVLRMIYPWGDLPKAGSRRCELIKAAALVVAEIERIDRLEGKRADPVPEANR